MNEEYRSCIVLGVRPDASAEEVKKAYRVLAREWHPDRIQGDDRRRREAEERIRIINLAYRALMILRQSPTSSQARGSRPADPGYDPFTWRQSVAESGRAAETLEDDRSFYGRALNLHFRGMDEFRARRYRDAISLLTQSVCLVYNNPEAFRTLGRSHRRLNQMAKSAAAYQKAVLLEPESAETRYELGQALITMGDLAGAEAEARALVPLDSELAEELRRALSVEEGWGGAEAEE